MGEYITRGSRRTVIKRKNNVLKTGYFATEITSTKTGIEQKLTYSTCTGYFFVIKFKIQRVEYKSFGMKCQVEASLFTPSDQEVT
jgi:hypothetical protein